MSLFNRTLESSGCKLLNILGADSQKLCDVIPLLHTLWIAPLQIIFATGLLYNLLGVSAVFALIAIVLLIAFTGLFLRQIRKLQRKQMTEKDTRLKLITETISMLKVRHIKNPIPSE